jgi:alpha-mannosidase
MRQLSTSVMNPSPDSRVSPYKRALAALALLSIASLLHAQDQPAISAGSLEGLMASLPAEARSTLEQLRTLNTLPAEQWRYHVGDLPHGESLALDDSTWTTVQPKSDAPAEAVWYRRTIEIPTTLHGYDTSGMRVSFHFEASAATAVPEIVYVNGNRAALGENLEPIVLTESAKPGERILVAVKLLQTAGPKRFQAATLRLEYAEGRPSPYDLGIEILSAEALIPSLSKQPDADRAVVEKALASVDMKALPADQPRFDASLRAAESLLAALRPMLQQATFHETGNSHIDAAWLWPSTETVDVVKRTFSTAAQLLNEYPKYTYTQSAAQYNYWVATKYPALNDEIKQQIAAGRWELVGGMWVEPDLNMPDGESLVRSILIGKRYYQKEYGVDVHIGWNPDSFGYNWQLPQIYKKSGIDVFVTQKMAWNDTNHLPFKLFWWLSPDGSKVLTYFPHDYGNEDLNPLRLSIDLAKARKQAPGLETMLDLYGVSDHGGGPTRAMLDEGMHWASPDKIIPNMKFGIAGTYFADVSAKIAPDSKSWNYQSIAAGYTYPPDPAAGSISIPTWKDELYFEYHRGVMTTQAKHKQNMRRSEVEALDAEKFASLAWLGGRAYPGDELTDAWKKITFNDFHDLAAGSGIGIIYREAQAEFDTVRRETAEITAGSLTQLDAMVDTRVKAGVPVLVWNPLAWERSGLVTVSVQMPEPTAEVAVMDAQDRVVPSQVLSSNSKTNTFQLLIKPPAVPAMGYSLLHVVSGKHPFDSELKSSALTLENESLRITIDKTNGCITSLYDKRAHFESLAAGACGNQLQAFKDKPKDYDAWNIDPGTLDVPPMVLSAAESVEVVDQTPLRTVVEIKRKWQSSTFTQRISLYTGMDHAIVSTDVDWRERHILLKAAFPLAASSPMATYEIPYGAIERPTTRNNSWEKAKFEVPALRWADLGDGQHGFSLINEAKYGYDGAGNVLRLSLLRSPTSPDPEADQGAQHFTYALYPHAGDWKQAGTVHHGYEFNYPLTAAQVAAHAGVLPARQSYVSVSTPTIILTAIKKAEDSNALILRMYESAGHAGEVTVSLPPGATKASLVNLMEKDTATEIPVTADKVQLAAHPWEIITLKVDYTPATDH